MATSPGNILPYQERKARRPSWLDAQENVELFASALASGHSTAELAELFSISAPTVRTWKRDPRVKAAAFTFIEDRILTVARKVDSEIEARLAVPAELSTDELLKIRKEFLGGALRTKTESAGSDHNTVNDAMNELEGDPELAKGLQDLLAKK